MPDIEKLAIEGTRIILLELPYRAYAKWMSEEIYNISAEYNLKVMLAHVHRYLPYYSKDEIEAILSTDAILQINNEAFAVWKEKKIAKRVINEYDTFAFGSDSHDLTSRKPNWDLLKKKVKPDIISASDGIFDKYKKNSILYNINIFTFNHIILNFFVIFKYKNIIFQSNLLSGTYPNTSNLIPNDFAYIINPFVHTNNS